MDKKYKQFKIERLDTISSSFCAAKWLKADIYLHTGKTSSCEKPTPHSINLEDLEQNVLAIHNTQEKINQRSDMLNGIQPEPCYQCWNIENITSEVATTRIIYSEQFSHADFNKLTLSDKIVPESITVMFDNYCNFVCTYCDPTQSTSWATDLIQNGPFNKLSFDSKGTYNRLGKKDRLSDSDSDYLSNKLIEMISEHIGDIKNLQFLGGEPTLNVKFWEFLEKIKTQNTKDLNISIVTNLSHISKVKTFLQEQQNFKKVKLLVSIDGTSDKAEFVRKGLKWKVFEENVFDLLENTSVDINFIGTINILSLDGLIELLDWIKPLIQKYPNRIIYQAFLVHHPVFQSINILPQSLKKYYSDAILLWIDDNFNHGWHSKTIESLKLLLVHLNTPTQNETALQKDFRYFVLEFSKRHKLSISCFNEQLVNFIREN